MSRGKHQALQTSSTRLPDLPECPGPKLHAFRYQNIKIEWLERLDQDRASVSTTESYVFKVKINSQIYALKVFKSFNPLSTRDYWEAFLGPSFSVKKAAFYTDPFYAECRAYGRIKEAEEKGTLKRVIAIPCHGYLLLRDLDEKILKEKGIDLRADLFVDEKPHGAMRGNDRVRAIVKDFSPQDSGLNSKTIRKVLRDIRFLNRKLEIYNMDIRADNFRNGLLVDFGQSWTKPHAILSSMDEEEAAHERLTDLVMFDGMIDEEKIKTEVRAMPNPQYLRNLRSWRKVQSDKN